MADFSFLHNTIDDTWVISAPRRAKRPDVAKGALPHCPFCPANRVDEVLYKHNDVVVLANKFPFAPIHEVIIHSSDHDKSFGALTEAEARDIVWVYRQRFRTHQEKGQVYIFHNHGIGGGESIGHPHSQLTVVPHDLPLEIPVMDTRHSGDSITTHMLSLFCPITSKWPDEVWMMPREEGKSFADATDEEVEAVAQSLSQLIRVFSLRYNGDFPFNFYIYPGKNWYLRFIPRKKILGGFEVGTGVFVNTQDPKETMAFIKDHYHEPKENIIKELHQADYHHEGV